MYATPALQRPIVAFAIAVIACWIYFGLVGVFLGRVLPQKVTPNILVHTSLFLVPAVLSGVFHFIVVRGSDLSAVRRCIQIIAAAIGAPILGWYLLVLASTLYSNESL